MPTLWRVGFLLIILQIIVFASKRNMIKAKGICILTFFLDFFFVDDHSRVLLNPIEGVAGSDYINANFIDVSFVF